MENHIYIITWEKEGKTIIGSKAFKTWSKAKKHVETESAKGNLFGYKGIITPTTLKED